ncbi:hypothetical protein F2Q69_00007373 [Brassica cretica]|uniref:Replication protein A 70 kDa DNA-binding subunit B/D first OB fold domain-containing protein n=1 Tax=Brassica cretica TaxID=69181 RepID=A0A8S9NM57_BRACR|nr:hypothetical protein F2Q69_00007373 [Brassica cretica]
MAMVQAPKKRVSFIRQLKPCKDTWRIEIRILRLWRNYNKDSGNTIKMVFVDKERTRIHASVGEQLIKPFEGKLTEGDAKVVQLFKLYDAHGDYRTTAHPYKIGFFQTTFVGTADEFPSEVLEKYFADYNDIVGGKLDNSRLGSVLLKLCSIKEWKGAYSISSGYNSIHILLNPTMDFIEEFKASLPNDSLALTNNDSSQWSIGTATSVRASIDAKRGWQYLNCKYHNKKVMPTTNVDADNHLLFFCNTCDKEHIEVISRFKLIAHVKNDSGETNFLLFDTNAQLIVRHSAVELYDETVVL